jgi:Delta24-sterol reductase
MENHQKAVEEIQSQIRLFHSQGQKIRIYHGSSNSTRTPNFRNGRVLDTSKLTNILKIDETESFALVEPSVPMDQLLDAALAKDLIPPVVMEFPGITVGGGIQGGAAESSAFKRGSFHETALEYEMVLGDGRQIIASRLKNPDLFWGTACTYGTLGVITLIKLKLVPALPYVKLIYARTDSPRKTLLKLDETVPQPFDFVDSILFSQGHGVVMSGTLTGSADGTIVSFMKRNDPWFYLHAKNISSRHDHYEEYIPIRDYLFRYDRGAFWMARHAYSLFHIPFNQTTRWLLDGEMHTRKLYSWLHSTEMSQRFIIQDICMPRSSAEKMLSYIDTNLGIYPLWLLPLKPSGEKLDKFGLSFSGEPLLINVGVWGKAHSKGFDEFASINRDIEREVYRLNGRKTLYAHAYYPRDEFWQLYDEQYYDQLRSKYNANTIFENLYDKVTVKHAYKAPLPRALWNRFRSDTLQLLTKNISF